MDHQTHLKAINQWIKDKRPNLLKFWYENRYDGTARAAVINPMCQYLMEENAALCERMETMRTDQRIMNALWSEQVDELQVERANLRLSNEQLLEEIEQHEANLRHITQRYHQQERELWKQIRYQATTNIRIFGIAHPTDRHMERVMEIYRQGLEQSNNELTDRLRAIEEETETEISETDMSEGEELPP